MRKKQSLVGTRFEVVNKEHDWFGLEVTVISVRGNSRISAGPDDSLECDYFDIGELKMVTPWSVWERVMGFDFAEHGQV